MRELDVLLLRYLDGHYAEAESNEQKGFLALLELQDPDVYALLMGRTISEDTETQSVVEKIRKVFSS